MELAGKVVVVTGGASGIGEALCRRFADEHAARVVVADRDARGAERVAESIGDAALGLHLDVTDEAQLVELVEFVLAEHGHIDLFCSNAGVLEIGGVEVADDVWRRTFDVNVMAHVYAARAVLPSMLARGSGYLLQTASAAGLLNQIGAAPYAVTKHAAIGLAEWLAITYGARGIRVSALCPQAVRTPMLGDHTDGSVAGVDGVLEPAEVAACVVEGLRDERFLILPHASVGEYLKRKADDYDRWLNGMRRMQARFGDLV